MPDGRGSTWLRRDKDTLVESHIGSTRSHDYLAGYLLCETVAGKKGGVRAKADERKPGSFGGAIDLHKRENIAMEHSDIRKKWQKIIAKAWTDDSFRQRLIAEPVACLKPEGIETAPGVELRVVEDTEKVLYLVLPPRPGTHELSMEELQSVAAGDSGSCSSSSVQLYLQSTSLMLKPVSVVAPLSPQVSPLKLG